MLHRSTHSGLEIGRAQELGAPATNTLRRPTITDFWRSRAGEHQFSGPEAATPTNAVLE